MLHHLFFFTGKMLKDFFYLLVTITPKFLMISVQKYVKVKTKIQKIYIGMGTRRNKILVPFSAIENKEINLSTRFGVFVAEALEYWHNPLHSRCFLAH